MRFLARPATVPSVVLCGYGKEREIASNKNHVGLPMKYFLLILLLGSYTRLAGACDCVMTALPQHIRTTPYLLTGTVLEVLDGTTQEGRAYRRFQRLLTQADTVLNGHSVRLRIQQAFKGKLKAGDLMEVDSHYSNCELTFGVGKQYLLFLHQEKERFFITMCSYSDEINTGQGAAKLMETVYQVYPRHR